MDNRMQWVLHKESIKKENDDNCSYITYEVFSEKRITGILKYDNYITCYLYEDLNDNGFYTYLIEIKQTHRLKKIEFTKEKYSPNGYFFKTGVLGEILSIFSFYFQACFYLKSTIVGTFDTKTRYQEVSTYNKIPEDPKYLHVEIFSDQSRNWNENGLEKFLNQIILFPQKNHQELIYALYWYSESIKEIRKFNYELFFIKMVSSIESILKLHKYETSSSDSIVGKLNTLKNEDFFEEEWLELSNWISNRKIKKRFIDFYQKYSKEFISSSIDIPDHCKIKNKDINEYIGRIYNARSRYLHAGVPMFISSNFKAENAEYWDLDPGGSMSSDRKIFLEKIKLPRMRWFENITNHCLNKFFEEIIKNT